MLFMVAPYDRCGACGKDFYEVGPCPWCKMKHEWKIGDWCEYQECRWLVFNSKDKNNQVCCVNQNGKVDRSHSNWMNTHATHFPDCTGWDWQRPKPIEPPPGYRLIADGILKNGDLSLQHNGWFVSVLEGRDIADALELGAARAYARKIEPEYRPFANAAELAPHREKWLVFSAADGSPSPTRISTYNDVCVWTGSSHVGYKYDEAFKELQFEDGTPFGVKVSDES